MLHILIEACRPNAYFYGHRSSINVQAQDHFLVYLLFTYVPYFKSKIQDAEFLNLDLTPSETTHTSDININHWPRI